MNTVQIYFALCDFYSYLEVIKIKLKDRRKANGFTQLDVAAYCGVKRSTVSKWESGAAFPRIDKLKKLAALFGCSVSELLEKWKE